MSRNIRYFEASRDRLFDYLLDVLIGNEAFFCHLQTSLGAPALRPGDGIAALPMHCDQMIFLPVSGHFHRAVLNEVTKRISIEFSDMRMPVEGGVPMGSEPGVLNRVQARLVAPVFLQLYETYKPWWIAKYSGIQNRWPAIIRFSWVIRNAISHRLRIAWDNPHSPPVEWRGLVYSHADNGKAIIGPDLSMADLIFLMIDLSDELDALGCPIEPSGP